MDAYAVKIHFFTAFQTVKRQKSGKRKHIRYSIVYISACRYVSRLAPHSLMGIRAIALTYGLSRLNPAIVG